jgi:hypothetical protein
MTETEKQIRSILQDRYGFPSEETVRRFLVLADFIRSEALIETRAAIKDVPLDWELSVVLGRIDNVLEAMFKGQKTESCSKCGASNWAHAQDQERKRRDPWNDSVVCTGFLSSKGS